MKLFLLKIVGLFVILSVLLSMYIYVSIKHISERAYFTIDSTTQVLILGNSHTACALQDSLLLNTKNCSEGGEAYFYTHIKLREILKINTIQKIYIQFGNATVEKPIDEWVWGKKYVLARVPQYLPFMNKEEIMFLFRKSPISMLRAMGIYIQNSIKRIHNANYNYSNILGGFANRKKSIQENEFIKTTDLKKQSHKMSIDNLQYLDKIVTLAEENNIAISFIRCPVTTYFKLYQDEDLFNQTKNNRYTNVKLYDFYDLELTDNYFEDYEHLNAKGALFFTNFFKEKINDK